MQTERNMDSRWFVTVAIIIVLGLYLLHPVAQPPPRKRRRTTDNKKKDIWPSLLSCVKWETISNMLHWKSEMAKLDGILDDLQPHQPGETASQEDKTHSC
jgi:hypothetical protein